MPKENVNGVDIFYQLNGKGEEVLVILNGIMMSTTSWNEAVEVYKKSYRVLRVDFRNQGQSTYVNEDFPIEIHAEDLKCLFDRLGFDKVHILGISYGAEVAMIFTLKYKEMVKSLILSNTTARVTNYLRAVGDSWDEAAKLYDGERFFKLAMPYIYSPYFYEQNLKWLQDRCVFFGKILKKDWFDAYMKLSGSTANYNIVEEIEKIDVPTLCIASDLDIITPISEVRLIHERIKGSRFVIIPNAGHASCYEKSEEFNTLVMGFLDNIAT